MAQQRPPTQQRAAVWRAAEAQHGRQRARSQRRRRRRRANREARKEKRRKRGGRRNASGDGERRKPSICLNPWRLQPNPKPDGDAQGASAPRMGRFVTQSNATTNNQRGTRSSSTCTPTPPSSNVPRAHGGGGEAVRLLEELLTAQGGVVVSKELTRLCGGLDCRAHDVPWYAGTLPPATTRALDPLPSRRNLIVSLKLRALTHWIKSPALRTVLH